MLHPIIEIPAIPLDAQINLENAARLRYTARTGMNVPLLIGGSASPAALPTLCDHCGARPGEAHAAAHTRRVLHICADCAARDTVLVTIAVRKIAIAEHKAITAA